VLYFLGNLIQMDFGTNVLKILDGLFIFLGIDVSPLVKQVIASVGVFLFFIIIGWLVYYIFESYFTKWAERTQTKLDDEILRNIKKPIYFFVILIGIYSALKTLTIPDAYSNALGFIFIISEILLATFIVTRVVNVIIAWYAEKRSKKKMNEHILFVLKKIINAIIFIFSFLIILYVLKIDLSGIAIGFGVGGIAIAFALQNVLSDVFSAFSIYFDKPFEIGDYIVIGEHSGTVKKIGMQSTRIQLLQGEELVISNKELTSTRLRNFKKMEKRRISFSFGVIYDTPTDKLKKIPGFIKDIVNNKKLQNIDRLDRVHFTEFGDFSLNFQVVYYLKTKDYAKYRDTQQEINFAIKEIFGKEDIKMAFPTQTIFINHEKT